ncbi:MAG TPA: diguanylate cyclase [Kofleriaceae bacterium]|nr:diguanylate cyclase [Kofleriaceae bacterium]
MDQPAAAGIVVLLVDDQPIVGEAIRRMLASSADITFHFCADAQRAIDTAAAVRPTTILQDLVMPGVDGFTLVQQMREHPATAQIPIIVLSSREDPRDKSRAFEIGASDYLVKLPDQIELVARIRAHSKSFLAQLQRDEAYRELEAMGRQLAEKNAILEALSSLDGLTGIANRRRFDEALQTEWRRGRREGTELSLLLIDVDFFKRYNDHYGHLAGDDCLRRVAAALRDSAHRAADLVARYGGEEFVILMGHTDAPGAAQVAETARRAIEELAIAHARSDAASVVTISLGSATLTPGNDFEGETLIKLADGALYQAKKDGRNRHRAAQQ